jgi:hypothetical protein
MLRRVDDNLRALEQGACLLRSLDDRVYRRALPAVFDSSIGGHIRHNLDHYHSFLCGLASGCIDYAARRRGVELESDRLAALGEFARIARGFRALLEVAGDDRTPGAIRVRREADANGATVASSLERELDFLCSHTIHHYAIVAILCRLQGIAVAEDFGVAPSTLRHRAGLAAQACAR